MDAETSFEVEHSPSVRRIDYFNPKVDIVTIPELRLRIVDSVLALPGAGSTPWAERRSGISRGTVTRAEINSPALGAKRPVSVYCPPGYSPASGPYPLILLLDGQHAWWRADTLFDNLLADRVALPFVAVLVGCGGFTSRLRDLAGNPDHVRFIVDDLVPYVESHFVITDTDYVVAGFSAGAVAAAFLGLQEPQQFSRVIALSGAYHLTTRTNPVRPSVGPAWLIDLYADAVTTPRRFYLAAGQFEVSGELSLYAQSTQFAEVLRRRGVDLRFDTGPTGHDTIAARSYLAAGINWMLTPSSDPVVGSSPVAGHGLTFADGGPER
jgi:enterochelin esterase family protein